MRKLILLLCLFLADSVNAQCVFEWGTNAITKMSRIITRDHAGNIIVIGPNGSNDNVRKYTSSGTLLFSKNIFSTGGATSRDCAVDENNNIYITGGYAGTFYYGSTVLGEAYSVCTQIFVLKIDPMGNLIWVKRSSGNYGSSADGNEDGYELSADAAGNCYVSGIYDANFIFGPFDYSGTGSSNFTAKLDALTGTVQWVHIFNDGFDMSEPPKTKALKSGDFFQAANYVWNVYVDSTTIAPAYEMWGNNLLVVMYDTNGALKWLRTCTGQGLIQSARMDSHQNLCLTGTMTDSLAFGAQKIYSMNEKGVFFLKIDTLGNVLKLERVISSSNINADIRVAQFGMDVDSLDNVFLSGRVGEDVNFNGLSSTDVVSSGSQSYAVKFDNTLTPVWFNTFGSTTGIGGLNSGIVKIPGKNAFTAGYFNQDITIDSVTLAYSAIYFYEYMAELCDQSGSFEVPTGLYEFPDAALDIFPNPASDRIFVKNLPRNEFVKAEIYNSSGQLVYFSEEPTEMIDISSPVFLNGLYLLKVRTARSEFASRFIVSK